MNLKCQRIHDNQSCVVQVTAGLEMTNVNKEGRYFIRLIWFVDWPLRRKEAFASHIAGMAKNIVLISKRE